jgi:hypothetical protein
MAAEASAELSASNVWTVTTAIRGQAMAVQFAWFTGTAGAIDEEG